MKAYILVKDSVDLHIEDKSGERMIIVRGVFTTYAKANAARNVLWESGERPEMRIIEYFVDLDR